MSKGLEVLEELKQDLTPMHFSRIEKLDRYKIIEKELQALEIIKTKLLVGCFSKEDNYSNYAMAIMMSGNETLKKNMMTEEEYNSVRDVLL